MRSCFDKQLESNFPAIYYAMAAAKVAAKHVTSFDAAEKLYIIIAKDSE